MLLILKLINKQLKTSYLIKTSKQKSQAMPIF